MPGISASGNMIPQSTTRMRSSTSRQKQLRPISPRPPRKTIRTGALMRGGASSPSGYRRLEHELLHHGLHRRIDQLDAHAQRVSVVRELLQRAVGVTAAELQRAPQLRVPRRVGGQCVGPHADVVEVGVLVALPHRARDLLHELEVRWLGRVTERVREDEVVPIAVLHVERVDVHDGTPRDPEQLAQVLFRRLDVRDDDADVVQPSEDRHGAGLYADRGERSARDQVGHFRVLVDVLPHVPARRDHVTPLGADVVEHAFDEQRAEPASAARPADLGVRQEDAGTDDLEVGDPDHLAVDEQLVTATVVVAADLVCHQLVLPDPAAAYPARRARSVAPMIELVTTEGMFRLDGGEWEVTNNIWLVGDDREVIVIDAAHDATAIVEAVNGRRVAAIALTHGHNDHINAAVALQDAVDAPLLLHPDDRMLWDDVYPDQDPDLDLI